MELRGGLRARCRADNENGAVARFCAPEMERRGAASARVADRVTPNYLGKETTH